MHITVGRMLLPASATYTMQEVPLTPFLTAYIDVYDNVYIINNDFPEQVLAAIEDTRPHRRLSTSSDE